MELIEDERSRCCANCSHSSLFVVCTVVATLAKGVQRSTNRYDLDGPPEAWERLVRAQDEPQLVLLADPFSVRVEALLAGLDYAFPNSPKIGGLASGATSPGLNALFLDDELVAEGAVGVALCGNVAIDTVVAQGCRPIGQPPGCTSRGPDDELHQERL